MKTYLYWIIAILITLSAAYYQRKTGPTHPARFSVSIENKSHPVQLVRSHGGTSDCPVIVVIPDSIVSATLYYKRYPTADTFSSIIMKRQGDSLMALLPNQPVAGKLEYYISFQPKDKASSPVTAGPVIIRFKGEVPAWTLVPHIFLMFFAMFFANLAGIMAIGRHPSFRKNTAIALGLLLIGGMIFGPLVQKFAFGALWTGIPFGYDLTDNKTLIGLIFWIIAWAGNRKKERPYLTIVAAIVLLLVYSIPHSMFGSELNYASGQVQTGWILLF